MTEVISGLPPAAGAEGTEAAGAGDATGAGPWIRRNRKLAIAVGATLGVGLVTAGMAWGLNSTDAARSSPVGVVPVTGETPTDASGGLVSGGQPAAPPAPTTPQFAPDSDAPQAPDAFAPPAPLPPMPPDPYANDPGLKAPAAAPLPTSPAGADGASSDGLPDDLGGPSQSGASGLDDPSYGPAGSPNGMRPQYRPDPPRYGSGGYRDQDRPKGPLGSLGDHNDDRYGGQRRGPVDDAVPGLGGLGGH